jgi:hypothetical protein
LQAGILRSQLEENREKPPFLKVATTLPALGPAAITHRRGFVQSDLI